MDLGGPARTKKMKEVWAGMATHSSEMFRTISSMKRDKHNAGVRPDTAIVFGGSMDDGQDVEYWIDVTGLSEVSHGHRNGSYRHIVKLYDDAINPGPAPLKGPSPIMITDEKSKRRKYCGLLEAAIQHVTAEVQWRAFVFTWQGTLADEAEDVIAAILKQHLTMLGEAPPGREAVPIKYQQAAFEKEYRDRIAVSIARGVGRMLVGAGHARQRRGAARAGG